MARQEILTFVCMTQNRLKNLKRLLPSVDPYVDRFVIVDGGSVDGTKEYCESFGDKMNFVHRKWDDNFAAQWNEYLKYINEGWVLICDDDEFPSEDMLKSTEYFINQSEYGNRFSVVQYRSNSVSEDLDMGPQDYWREMLFRYVPTLHYQGGPKTGCHQYAIGYQNNRVIRCNFVYYHVKSLIDEYKNASRNYFIYGIWPHGSRDGTQTEEWHELKEILSRVHPEVEVFPDLDNHFIANTVHQEVKDWLIKWNEKLKDEPNYNEMRAMHRYYFELLHPEESENK